MELLRPECGRTDHGDGETLQRNVIGYQGEEILLKPTQQNCFEQHGKYLGEEFKWYQRWGTLLHWVGGGLAKFELNSLRGQTDSGRVGSIGWSLVKACPFAHACITIEACEKRVAGLGDSLQLQCASRYVYRSIGVRHMGCVTGLLESITNSGGQMVKEFQWGKMGIFRSSEQGNNLLGFLERMCLSGVACCRDTEAWRLLRKLFQWSRCQWMVGWHHGGGNHCGKKQLDSDITIK